MEICEVWHLVHTPSLAFAQSRFTRFSTQQPHPQRSQPYTIITSIGVPIAQSSHDAKSAPTQRRAFHDGRIGIGRRAQLLQPSPLQFYSSVISTKCGKRGIPTLGF